MLHFFLSSTFNTPTNTHPLTFFHRQNASIVFFLSYHSISSPEARNFSNLTRKHNESFLCMLYIIFQFFFILILTPCPLTPPLSLLLPEYSFLSKSLIN